MVFLLSLIDRPRRDCSPFTLAFPPFTLPSPPPISSPITSLILPALAGALTPPSHAGHAAVVAFSDAVLAEGSEPTASGLTLLSCAVLGGNVALLRALLQSPSAAALLNRADNQGNAPVHHAVIAANAACLEALCCAGALCGPNAAGETPVTLAAAGTNPYLTQVLADHLSSADLNAPNRSGVHPIGIALTRQRNPGTRRVMVARLLSAGEPDLDDVMGDGSVGGLCVCVVYTYVCPAVCCRVGIRAFVSFWPVLPPDVDVV